MGPNEQESDGKRFEREIERMYTTPGDVTESDDDKDNRDDEAAK